MLNRDRIVVRLPLAELWNLEEHLHAYRTQHIGRNEIRAMLQSGEVRFVVADCGHPLKWIPSDERFAFWKEEVVSRLVENDSQGFDLDDYAGGYCYVASEWADDGASPIVVLEKHH